jgi:cytolysin-activating lysine-acyltransferase
MTRSGKKARGTQRVKQTGQAKRQATDATAEMAMPQQDAAPGTGSGASSANGSHASEATAETPAAKTVSQVLGEITWLMTQSPRHKAMTLADLEWLVMPAILLKQFRMFYKGEQPVGVVLWALTDDIVAKRIDTGNTRLTPAEWKSGTMMRIVDVVAPFGGEAEMRGQFGGESNDKHRV